MRTVNALVQVFLGFVGVVLDPEHHQGLWAMVTALAACASVLVVAVAAVVALRQLREARTLRLAQMRPFVVVEFVPLPNMVVFLRISNLGSIMARNIRLTFDRPLVSLRKPDLMELQVLKSGIKSLAPNRTIEFMFDTFIGRGADDDRYLVKVDYSGDGHKKPFHDEFDLDLGVWRNTTPLRQRGLDEIHAQLEKVASLLSDFRASGGGLLVLSPDDVSNRDESLWEAFAEKSDEGSAEPGAKEPREPASGDDGRSVENVADPGAPDQD